MKKSMIKKSIRFLDIKKINPISWYEESIFWYQEMDFLKSKNEVLISRNGIDFLQGSVNVHRGALLLVPQW